MIDVNKFFEQRNFYENKQAFSFSVFSAISPNVLSQEIIEELKNISKTKNDTCRVCMHTSPQSELQFMLICHPCLKDTGIKKYLNQDAFYMAVEGEFQIIFYDEFGKQKNSITLSKSENLLCSVPKGQYYEFKMLTPMVLVYEIRNGPFKKEEQIYLRNPNEC